MGVSTGSNIAKFLALWILLREAKLKYIKKIITDGGSKAYD